jgi:Phage tail protein
VKDIKGLDPVKATLVSSSIAQLDGADFQHARREPRNILLTLGLEPDYVMNSVASLRNDLYDYFMTKMPVGLEFYMDEALFAMTGGIVESNENNMFSADPEVNISVICYDPDFYDTDVTTVSGVTVSDTSNQVITYPGTTDTGVIFSVTLPAGTYGIDLVNTRPDNITNLMRITGTFLANDILTVNTIPRQKAVTVTRAGLPSSALFFLDKTSSWISLMRGDNLFRAYYSGASLPFTLDYTAKFGGL